MLTAEGSSMQIAPPIATATRWRVRDRVLDLTTPLIAAICNVTPDSFSDGGEHYSVELAVSYAEQAWRDGATIFDIGGESTRPGADAITAERELDRVLPVVIAVRERVPELIVSVDTVKASVARAALTAGAHLINDVSGGRLDAEMFRVVAEARAGLVLMHSRGGVTEMAMYAQATYGDDVMAVVIAELRAQLALAVSAGVEVDQIALDPGIGFAKTPGHSLEVLRSLPRLVALDYPVFLSASRKRMIGDITAVTVPSRRTIGSVVAHMYGVTRGAKIIRTHDVSETREALAMTLALM
jgi:dihydropteroate synthase